MARPSSYKPEFAEQARKLCLLGATDKEMADVFGVSETTLNNWKTAHPEFLVSLKAGKDEADANVADRLYQRAMGYSHPAEKIVVVAGAIERVAYTEHYPPDTTAAIFWLKNRKKREWRDKIDHEMTGADGGPIDHSVSVKFVDGNG
ncbi:helix-turn-helix domain-containing protein [Cupriavidus respiraculi]|uniref:helix-turn-helix domain-containing protein n=1 Tax=Cupriavidus respiraculi TaxID=195930 RepID=UPI001C98E144|nr:helix-turn-helix domain-containing protein [Cupriavidus respiraculi]MBY4947010.1 helix-turn-helix domain-containing protein [Cupriavidus respiraculi]